MSHLSLHLKPATAELSTLRASLREFLISFDEPPDDWLVMATELVTNAISAAPDESTIEVTVDVKPKRIDLCVVDMGTGFEFRPRNSVPTSAVRGRGLMMVKAMADDFTVSTADGQTIATASRQRSDDTRGTEGTNDTRHRSTADSGEATTDARPARHIDVVVIGLGSAGEVVAKSLTQGGLSVVGFERHRVGGECPFVACMPSKSLLADAHAARHHDDPRAAWPAAIERREQIVSGRDDSEHLDGLVDEGVEVVRASARIVGMNKVEADGILWEAEHVVLATGSAPVFPDIEGLERDHVWSPFDALSASTLPERVGIIGAGPVGCELADIYRSFGSKVFLLDRSDRLLADHDAAVADTFEKSLRELGIELSLDVEVDSIQHGESGDVITHSGAGGTVSVTVDQIIVASGQAPRLDDLGLENVGLDPEDPPSLDEHRRVSEMPWLSMIGDLNGQNPWTHGANRDASILADAILDSPWASTNAAMPRATFTTPTAAHVGQAATDENGLIRGTASFSDIARGSTDQLEDGLVVVTVDPSTGIVVGCSAVGPLADELIATATSLVHFEITIDRARTQVFAFPTISQVLEVAIAEAADRYAAHPSV